MWITNCFLVKKKLQVVLVNLFIYLFIVINYKTILRNSSFE